MTKNTLIIGIVSVVFINVLFGYYLYSRQNSGNTPFPGGQVTVTQAPNGSPSPTSNTTNPTSEIKLFFIKLEDNGKSGKKIGCEDSVVAVTKEIPETEGILRASLQQLLSVKEQKYGQAGLYNSLYQSNLQVNDIAINNGKATIKLMGDVKLGGVCDSPRFEAQLKETALQFPTVKEVEITINDRPLGEIISGY